MLRNVLLCALIVLAPVSGTAQQPDRRPSAQIADSVEIATLARRLTAAARSDSARAAAIYEWVARNVAYDVDGYRRGGKGGTAETTYRTRLAVCRGFVALFERLAREAELTTEPVLGYAKGFDYVHGRSTRKPNHTWLALHLNGEWRLIDPTWGAGHVLGDRFQPQFTWDYFLIAPEVLALSHFPADSRWQLGSQPLTRAEFERLSMVPRVLVQVGFGADALRRAAQRSPGADFPSVGVPSASVVQVVQAPVSGTIRRAAKVPLQVSWSDASEMAVVTGGVWFPLDRSGGVFFGEPVALGNTLYVVGRTSPGQPYHTLLMYRVD